MPLRNVVNVGASLLSVDCGQLCKFLFFNWRGIVFANDRRMHRRVVVCNSMAVRVCIKLLAVRDECLLMAQAQRI